MDKKKGASKMLISTLIMSVFALLLLLIGYFKGGELHVKGLKSAGDMMIEILPLLVFAMIVASMIPLLLSKDIIVSWIGSESGFKGILIGSVAGGLTPGGPLVSFPIAAGLLHSGASVSAIVAYITGWLIFSITRLPMEIGILGWKFTFIRIVSTFVFPPIAGLIAQFYINATQ